MRITRELSGRRNHASEYILILCYEGIKQKTFTALDSTAIIWPYADAIKGKLSGLSRKQISEVPPWPPHPGKPLVAEWTIVANMFLFRDNVFPAIEFCDLISLRSKLLGQFACAADTSLLRDCKLAQKLKTLVMRIINGNSCNSK
jgi:hypothetical protein